MIKIHRIISLTDGKIYAVQAEQKKIKIFVSNHAIERINCWNIYIADILYTLIYPEEVVIGHHKRFIAHRRKNKHIYRVVYEYRNNIPRVITVYYPYAERYWQGGGKFADKILTRR